MNEVKTSAVCELNATKQDSNRNDQIKQDSFQNTPTRKFVAPCLTINKPGQLDITNQKQE